MELLYNTKDACYGLRVYIFNLPAPETCKPAKWCFGNCCALKIKLNNNLKKNGLIKYKISQSEDFSDIIIEEINRKKIEFIRVHSSGDFYSKDYVKKWINISKKCPNTLFRTSTRRYDLKNIFLKLNTLPNFVVRESIDPLSPKPIMGLPVSAIETIPGAEIFFRCERNCEKCGYYCWYHKVNECSPILNQKQWTELNTYL